MKRSLATQDWLSVEANAPPVQVENVSRITESHTQKTVIVNDLTFIVPVQGLFAINGLSGTGGLP